MSGGELRAGVVGVGSLGQHHARIYAQMESVRLVGVADVDPERRETVAARWEVPALEDWRSLLDQVDLVSIAVPSTLHHEVAREFLAQGCHVLLEKPIATSMEQASDLNQLARSRGVVLQVGHLERFNPAFLAVRDHIKKPLFVECHRLGRFAPRVTDVDVVLDLMIHDIDLLLSWSDGEPVDVQAVGVPVLSREVDLASARIQLSDGCVANLTASRVSFEPARKIRVFLQDRYVSIDTLNREVRAFERIAGVPPDPENPMAPIRPIPLAVGDAEPLLVELEGFVRAVRHGEEPAVSGEAAARALDLALQIKARIGENLTRRFKDPA